MHNKTVAFILLSFLASGLKTEALSTEPQTHTHPPESNPVVETIDFINDLVPMFTKLGCNAGKCHGSAIGRGGFKLSLYGGTPKSDYEAITRRQAGRRINVTNPESSLVFTKPSEIVEHGGGEVLTGGENAELLIKWIKQGAQFTSHRKLKHIEVHPTRFLASRVEDSTAMKVKAHYHDGSTRDVTHLTQFTADDPSAVKINRDLMTAQPLRTGQHIVLARYPPKIHPKYQEPAKILSKYTASIFKAIQNRDSKSRGLWSQSPRPRPRKSHWLLSKPSPKAPLVAE